MRRKFKKDQMKTAQVNAAQKGIRHKELDSIRILLNKGASKGFSELVRYTKEYPEDPYGQRLLGIELLKRKDYEGAKQAFRRVINAHGKNQHGGFIGLALTNYQEGNLDDARQYYEEAIQNNPYNELTAYIYLACLERDCKNYYRALNILYSALEIKPHQEVPSYDHNDVKLQIARTLFVLEKYEEAKEILQSLTANTQHQARELAYSKAIIYKQKEQYKEALEAVEVARKTNKKDELYYLSTLEQSKIYKQMGMLNESLISLEELSAANVLFDGAVPFSIGVIKLLQKDYYNAMTSFHETFSSRDYAIRNHAIYYYSALKYLSGDLLATEKILTNSLVKEEEPFHMNCLVLIRMLYDQERYQDALDYLAIARNKKQNLDENFNFRRMEILIAQKQGKKLPPIRETSYLEKQLVDYKIENAIRHDLGKAIENGYTYTYSDIETLYEKVAPLLTEDNKLMISALDEYKIPNPSILMCDGTQAESLWVKTLPGTKEIVIVDAWPAFFLPTVGELSEQKAKQKSKSNDTISRFNARLAKSTSKI